MNRKHTRALFNKYPLFLRGRSKPITHNLMGFGFECGPGWRKLMEPAFAAAEAYCQRLYRHRVPKDNLPLAVQVKEKFGTLRIYYHGGLPAEVAALFDQAEAQSAQTCEQCGAPTETTETGGWLSTRCNACTDKREADRQRYQAEAAVRRAWFETEGPGLFARLQDTTDWVSAKELARFIDRVCDSYQPLRKEVESYCLANPYSRLATAIYGAVRTPRYRKQESLKRYSLRKWREKIRAARQAQQGV